MYDIEGQHLCLGHRDQQALESPANLETAVPAPSSRHLARYEYLDGLRGLASLSVFFSHITPDFTRGVHEHGFGQDGVHWHFTSLPFIRLIWSGGNAAVAIFFILSGYALSIGPLRTLSHGTEGKGDREVQRGLLGAAVRRPLRLYAPPLTIAVVQAVMLQIPGLVVIDLGLPPWPRDSIVDELDSLIWSLRYFNPFRNPEIEEPFPYNKVMWTMPIELRGSLVVYGFLLILSMGGVTGPNANVPAALSMSMLLGGAIVLQVTCDWSTVCFAWGIVLAMTDVWPIGIHLREQVRRLHQRWIPVSAINNFHFPKARPLPAWCLLSNRLLKPGTFVHACFFTGWYLLSEPGYPGHRHYSANTPGWTWLTQMIPSSYDDARFHRYWTSIGALLVVYAVLRIRWLQTFFQLRALRFLGTISFSLYLLHIPWTHIFADRIKSYIGGPVSPELAGGVWDHGFEISDAGPPGLSPMFLVGMSVILPSTLFVAWLGTIAVDRPSVRMSKWFIRKIGIDRPSKASMKDEGNLLLK